MKITKTIPVYKDYIWGGEKLKAEYGKQTGISPLAESWELAAHKDGASGFEGSCKTIAELFESDRALFGTNAACFDKFPMMIKLIDAKQNLSVQVHPSDDYALANENSYGKTEMWYIVEAEPGAGLYMGLKRDITPAEFEAKIADGTLTDVLNFVPVKKGEHYFIESGTVHAIGAGVVICEIQQNSNLTYRLFDYGRVDKNGNPRELHVEKGKAVSKLTAYTADERSSCKYFTCADYSFDGTLTFNASADSFVAVLVLDGGFTLDGVNYRKGDTVFVPAATGNFTLKGKAYIVTAKI